MTFPAVTADSDPDPTTQITWPTARPKRTSLPHEELTADGRGNEDGTGDTQVREGTVKNGESNGQQGTGRLSTWNLFTLSISMAGAQIAWTVELGYVQLCTYAQITIDLGFT